MVICERCGTESPNGFRFCGVCGAALPPDERPGGARKVVTALFCDMAGSTELGERLDPELLRNVINRYFESMTDTIERHGGTVQKFAGDAVMAVFGIPRVHEDDALRAVRAAAEMHGNLAALAEEVGVTLRFRTGINTGLVLSDEGRSLALGDPVNVAARLEQAAAPDEILLGYETLRQVRDAVEVEPLEPLTLKGKAAPVRAFRLLDVDPTAPGVARRFDVGLVGRQRELEGLRRTWELTVASSSCQALTLIGPAGVGKSRLAAELLAEVEDRATILSGRCLPYGEGITFWPLIESMANLGEEAEPVRNHLAAGGMATPEELFMEVRLLLESLARSRPVILNIDDLQWAEPMLLELLAHVVSISAGAPILVLCTTRPELLEERPGGGGEASVVVLEPLGAEECEQLLEELGGDLTPESRARAIQTSEGNPLFLQELVAFTRERATTVIPPTIQALLGARLERLAASEREPLERGAVEGQVFHRSAVSALGAGPSEDEIAAQLDSLVRKDLIRPHPGTPLGADAFRFRHLLIRDATYERLPLSTRAELHQRFASWLEDAAGGLLELDEIAGWHLEQAVRYKRELRAKADPVLTRRAAEHLYAAGRRAGERSDAAAAGNLLGRALEMMPPGDPLRPEASLALAERLIETGELARADELFAVAEDEPGVALLASLDRLEWLVLAQPDLAPQAIESRLPQLVEQLDRVGDDRGLAKAHMLFFWRHWGANNATLAAAEARLAAEHARAAGDGALRARALGWYIATLMYGRADAEAITGALDVIADEAPGPYLTACVELGRAEVERLHGSFDRAAALTDRAFEAFGGLGMRILAAGCHQLRGRIELSRGDGGAARELLLESDRVLAELGERSQRSTTQALLARACLGIGDTSAAAQALALAEELASPEEVTVSAITHEVRAGLALADGDPERAERPARAAVRFASATDFVGFQAEARLGLARVLAGLRRADEATAEATAAAELFATKADRPGRAAAAALLGALRSASGG